MLWKSHPPGWKTLSRCFHPKAGGHRTPRHGRQRCPAAADPRGLLFTKSPLFHSKTTPNPWRPWEHQALPHQSLRVTDTPVRRVGNKQPAPNSSPWLVFCKRLSILPPASSPGSKAVNAISSIVRKNFTGCGSWRHANPPIRHGAGSGRRPSFAHLLFGTWNGPSRPPPPSLRRRMRSAPWGGIKSEWVQRLGGRCSPGEGDGGRTAAVGLPPHPQVNPPTTNHPTLGGSSMCFGVRGAGGRRNSANIWERWTAGISGGGRHGGWQGFCREGWAIQQINKSNK